jgi:hypothetical protein
VKTIEYIGIPRYNGLILPGYDTKNPVTPKCPRWMIVWDRAGWTKPVRRIVVMFDGKFLDTDGNYWDFGSDIPYEYATKNLQDYWKIPEGLAPALDNLPPLGNLFRDQDKADW